MKPVAGRQRQPSAFQGTGAATTPLAGRLVLFEQALAPCKEVEDSHCDEQDAGAQRVRGVPAR